MYIFGDTHGDWKTLSEDLSKIKESNVIIAGDFGYWPNFSPFSLKFIHMNGCHIYFCPGNHENWDALRNFEQNSNKRIIEIFPNIFYCTFGSVLNIENYNIMFCGGADSIDKGNRTEGINWFREEIITEHDMYSLPERNDIDIIISHTGPRKIIEILNPSFGYRVYDQSCDRLSWIWKHYNPKLWIFAHFHQYGMIKFGKTLFYQLNRENCRGHILKLEKNFHCGNFEKE